MRKRSNWKPKLSLMNKNQIIKLHSAAKEILETTGINVHHPEMRQKLLDSGAKQGEDPQIFIPEGMVEQSINIARQEIVIYDRLGRRSMTLGPHNIYFGTGSDLIYTRDTQTTERRESVLKDVEQSALLCDALDEIDFVMSFALPKDVRNEDAEPQQYSAILMNTVKPPIMTSFSGIDGLRRMHEMACIIANGEESFRQRPNYILYGQFVSPLQHDFQAIERLMFCADHEIPLIYIPTIMPGVSGPITLAGSLALAAAESLAGLVMTQIQSPGAPFIFGACVSPLDMRTMLFPYGSPEWRINDLVMAELSRYYGLPVFGTAGATDSKMVDAQTGADYASSLLVSALAGTNLIHDIGYLDTGLCGSLESILLGAELVRWVKQFINGMEVCQETLASDVIAEIGPGGQFLDHDHTIENFRKNIFLPFVFDRNDYAQWITDGANDYAARARETAKQIISSHQPTPVDDLISAELKIIANIAS